MMKMFKRESVSKGDLKCISVAPLAVGGNGRIIKMIDSGIVTSFDSTVSSLMPYGPGIIFGLSNGKLGLLGEDGDCRASIDLHRSNICALDVCRESILTGSWDHSAMLLRKSDTSTPTSMDNAFYSMNVFPHPETVWTVCFVSENEFITGCADKKIRVFCGGKCTEIDYHDSVVRGVVFQGGWIYSVDNYGTVIKTSKNGKIEKSRNLGEMCFCICVFEDYVLVGGDNGSVFILNKDLEALEKIKLSCPSCWSIAVRNGHALVAGSDGVLYYLEKGQDDTKDDAADYLDSKKDGTFVANGIRYKMEAGKVYIENGNEWDLMGEKAGAFDHSFTIELEGKEYVLSFNDKDNVHEIASKFLRENKLNGEYHQEIVNYINHTFKRPTLYRRYDTIDIDGISRLVGAHPILEILRRVGEGEKFSMFLEDSQNVCHIEKTLFRDEIPMFAVLDICKYLWSKGIGLDLSFLFKNNFQDRKEAKAFAYLMANIVENPPFNIASLHRKLRRLKDLGYLTSNDTSRYEENLAIKNK